MVFSFITKHQQRSRATNQLLQKVGITAFVIPCICRGVPLELVLGVKPKLAGSERASLNCEPFPYLQTSADALIAPMQGVECNIWQTFFCSIVLAGHPFLDRCAIGPLMKSRPYKLIEE